MQSREINILKATLPILVVLIHCNYLQNAYGNAQSIDGFVIFLRILSDSVLSLAVPTFFFISGFLFFSNGPVLRFKDYLEKMRRRARTLLIPYLIWNLLGFLLLCVKMLPPLHQHFPQYSDSDLSLMRIILGFWSLSHSTYPYDMPLWFIRNLIVVQCFAYIIGMLLRLFKAFTLVPAVVAVALLDICWPEGDPYGLVSSFFFFTIGAVASCCMKSVFLPARRIAVWMVGYAGIVTLYMALGGTFLFYFKTAAGILLLGKLAATLAAGDFRPSYLMEKSSFFVYAFHGLFITVTQKLAMSLIRPVSDLPALVDYVIIFIVLYGVSLAAFVVLDRHIPGLTRLLCGGR